MAAKAASGLEMWADFAVHDGTMAIKLQAKRRRITKRSLTFPRVLGCVLKFGSHICCCTDKISSERVPFHLLTRRLTRQSRFDANHDNGLSISALLAFTPCSPDADIKYAAVKFNVYSYGDGSGDTVDDNKQCSETIFGGDEGPIHGMPPS